MKWTNRAVSAPPPLLLAAAALLLAVLTDRASADAPVNPNPVTIKTLDDDGNEVTVEECVTGNSKSHHRRTCGSEYTVLTCDGHEYIAAYDEETGELKCSTCSVTAYVAGTCNPAKMQILENEWEDQEVAAAQCGEYCHKNDANPKLNSVIQKFKKDKLNKAKAMAAKDDKDRRAMSGTVRRAAAKGNGNGNGNGNGRRRDQVDGGEDLVNVMYNLVLLIRFKDHKDRVLPSEEEIGHLFNAVDGHPDYAPTGSVRDCFRYNSYNKFDLQSKICNWCDVQHDEAYYGDYFSGMTRKLTEAIRECLDECQSQYDLNDFDINEDGEMDAIAILHSGYGAEWMAQDCQNPDPLYDYNSMIWSHKWEMSCHFDHNSGSYTDCDHWTGTAGVTVKSYHISPALWGTCGSSIGRIGVICHETGHFFGLPDLYDGTPSDNGRVGSGVGTTCLMGNSWGYRGDQYYPPLMSAWSRLRLGWAEPELITQSGEYSLLSAATNDRVLAYVNPYNHKEYFLFENKQRHEFFDLNIPQTGINVYHIDDDATYTEEGFPGSEGWPEEHYRVAVVQPDGQFALEKGESFGDSGDVFHLDAIDYWGPDGVGKSNGQSPSAQIVSPHPNTNWYSSGSLVDSGFKMYAVSKDSPVMTFQVEVTAAAVPATTTTTTTTTTPVPVVEDTSVMDFGGADSEPSGKETCGGKMDDCATHSDCCSLPKMRCKFIKKVQRMACKPKDAKKKKKRMRRRRRLMKLRMELKEGDADAQENQQEQ